MKYFLLSLLVSINCYAGPSEVQGDIAPGLLVETSFILNPDCARDTTSIVLFGGGAISRTTTNPVEPPSSCLIDANSSGQIYSWTTATLFNNLSGQQCRSTFSYIGDGTLYKAYVKNGTTLVSQEVTLSNVSTSSDVVLQFPCGDLSTTTTFRIEATSNSAAALRVGKVKLGIDPIKLKNETTIAASTYTAKLFDDVIELNTASNAITLSLPAAVLAKGKIYHLIQTSSSNATTIDPSGSETICGEATISLVGIRDSMTITSDGSNWLATAESCRKKTFMTGACSSSSSITRQDGAATIGNISGGACNVTIPGFGNAPSCVISRDGAPGASEFVFGANPTNSSNVTISCKTSAIGNCTGFNFNLLCDGIR